MYLNKLNFEEKRAFLSLAYLVAESNGIFEEAEKNMISQYCLEMGINDIKYSETSLESAVSVYDNSTKVVKNIVILELIGLCLTDGEYDSAENDVLEKIALSLDISKETIVNFRNDLKDYFEVVTKMTKHIFS